MLDDQDRNIGGDVLDEVRDALALGGGKTGSELQTPMAVVILSGLATSTLLNMLVVPTLYLKYARPPIDRAAAPVKAQSS